MMREDNKIIFYGDLLGFTNYLNRSEKDAIECLNNTQITSRLNEKFFNDLLFISDSIIGITDDCNTNNVIREIAKYLANTYRFNRG